LIGEASGAYQVGPPQLVDCFGVVQLDVQVLVDAFERTADLHLILELHSDFVLDECLEETMAPVSRGFAFALGACGALCGGN
jgi:hypothetical protein